MMSTTRVKHGETFALSGTIAASDTLIGLTGDPGALIAVDGTAVNKGLISLYGAKALHKQGATLSDAGVLNNGGTILVGGATNSAHAALLSITGALTNNGALYAGAGSYGTGGTIDIAGSGTLRNTGMLILGATGGSDATGGSLVDVGVLLNEATGVVEIQGAVFDPYPFAFEGAGASATITNLFTNNGTLLIQSADDFGTSAAATVTVAGTLRNNGYTNLGIHAHAVYQSAHPVYQSALLLINGLVDNTGTLVVNAPYYIVGHYTTSIGATIIDNGTLANEGLVDVGGFLNVIGNLENAGTLVDQGVIDDEGVATNTGTIEIKVNSNLAIDGTLTSSGDVILDGGYSNKYPHYNRGIRNGGSIAVTGLLVNSGTINLVGGVYNYHYHYGAANGPGSKLVLLGTFQNAGLLSIGGGAGGYRSLNGYPHGLGAVVNVESKAYAGFVNSGTIDIQNGETSALGIYGAGGTLALQTALLSGAGSLITIDGGQGKSAGVLAILGGGELSTQGNVDGSGVLHNNGLIYLNHGHISHVGLINDGTISGRGVINSAITADSGRTGILSVGDSDKLSLNGSVAASQTVVFYGSEGNPDLKLSDPATFAGTLSGIAATDTLDFVGLIVTAASTSGDTLTITESGGVSVDLALAAPLTGLDLVLGSDMQSGTALTFTPAPAV